MGAGPQALLRDGLMQKLRASGHDVELVPVESTAAAGDQLASAFDLASKVARVARASRSAGRFPLTLSGSCFSTVGAFAGAADESTGVLWFDAHGDLNTPETSPSGFVDGMAAATLLGWCYAEDASAIQASPLAEARLMLAGTRDLDPPEAAALAASAVTSLSPTDLANAGSRAGALDAFMAGMTSTYLHVDLDVLDPVAVGRANEFASPDGVTLQQMLDIVAAAGARTTFAGMTLSAYDPAGDGDGAVRRAAIEIIAHVLGEVQKRTS